MTDPFDLRVRRRDVLRGGAGLVLAAGLAGCGVNNGAKGDTQRVVKAKIDGDLSYFNWDGYLDPSLIKTFEKRYGVTVRESNFDSMPGMVAKLSGGNRYDVIFPSAEYAQRLIQGKQLLRIDRDQVPNARSLYPDLQNPWYDPKNEFTVPYALYATGIIYRADKVKMTGSWADLGNPSANGRAFILDDYQEGLGAANLYNGFGLNTTQGSQLDKSKAWLESLKPRIRGFSSDSVGNVVSGNALIQHAWNGDTINARNQVKDPENIKFQQCSQGVPVGNDCFAIPVNAAHPGTALTFMNFILEASNAEKNINYVGYPMPYTDGPDEAFAKLAANDPSINVTVQEVATGKKYANLGASGRRAWDQAWTEVKAA